MHKTIALLQEFSVPLILGVISAVLWANIAPESYHIFVESEFFFGLNLHFLVNEIFMVFFFAIAAVEITQSVLPGGDLNPVKKAVNPLLATLGGVLGPVIIYLVLNALLGSPEYIRGWGIPTATDIALAWLTARFLFGAQHPAVKFLLLLAIVDDAVGLLIIAVFYPDPLHPVQPIWLFLTLAAIGIAFLLRKNNVRNYLPYLLTAGLLSWAGLFKAHLHPALALVFIIPFLPHPSEEKYHLYEEDPAEHSALAQFEHHWKTFVDFGLFFFGIANAGVEFSSLGIVTWLVFISLFAGKTIGVTVLGMIAAKIGFPLPDGMGIKELILVGMVAGLGLTVALFVAGAAFSQPDIQAAAKMGALFSAFIAAAALSAGRIVSVKKIN